MATKILIVDDSAFTRLTVKNALNRRGFRDVIEAENGEEGLRKYEVEEPDAVFLDVIMPDINGVEVLKEIMVKDENATVIMLSAVGQERTMKICGKLGSAAYVVKPFEDRQLVITLENALCAKRKSMRARSPSLTEFEEDAFREIGHIGAQQAAKAFSKLIGEKTNAKLLAAGVASLDELPSSLGNREAMVSGIYLPISGDLSGSLLMVFPEKSAFLVADMMFKRKMGTTKEFNKMDKSALSEVGNILAGNCLTAMSHVLGMHLVEHIPDFAHGMVGALVDNVAVSFGKKAEQALIIQVELNTEKKIKIVGYFFLLFDVMEAQTMLRAIESRSKGEVTEGITVDTPRTRTAA